jgi:hypothetical protein
MFCPENGIIEIRAFEKNGRIFSGYYDRGHIPDATKRIRDFEETDGFEGIYVVFNETNPALLARKKNRIALATKNDRSTSDADVTRRRWFLIDCDPERPSGISASDEEKAAGVEKAYQVRDMLLGVFGEIEPVICDSGNGAHLLYKVDLEPSEENNGLIKKCLIALASIFDDSKVKIDLSVWNQARLTKLYGTTARKGDHTDDRPHRKSRIIHIPESIKIVKRGALENLAKMAPTSAPSAQRTTTPTTPYKTGGEFDLRAWMDKYGGSLPEYTEKTKSKFRFFWEFKTCPWDPGHTDGAAWVGQFNNGAVAAGCHHNGCSGEDWHTLREKFEGKKPTLPKTDVSRILQQQPKKDGAAIAEGEKDETPERKKLDFTPFKSGHVIRDYIDLFMDRTGGHAIFKYASALTAIALVTDRRAVSRLSFGDVHPNVFCLLLGMTSDSGKTSTVKEFTDLSINIHEDFRNKELPNRFSPEGFFKALSAQPKGFLAKDEISALIAGMNRSGGYLAAFREDLCEFYDNPGVKIRQLSKDTITASEIFVQVLAATTLESFEKHIDPIDLESGFLARFLIFNPGDEQPVQIPVRIRTQQNQDEINALKNHLKDIYLAIKKFATLNFIFSETALKKYDLWNEIRVTGQKSTIERSISARLRTYVFKLAILYYIGAPEFLTDVEPVVEKETSRFRYGEQDSRVGIFTHAEITVPDYWFGIALRHISEYFLPQAVKCMGEAIDNGNETNINLILRCLKKAEGKQLGRADLLLKVRRNVSAKDLDDIIKTLWLEGKIDCFDQAIPGKNGRTYTKTVYKLEV